MKIKTNSTRHSAERAEERLSLNNRQSDKEFRNAWLYGKRSYDMYGKPFRVLEKRSQDQKEAVFYRDNIFVFSKEARCITVFPAPACFTNRYCGKTSIRSIIKYNKMTGGNIGRRSAEITDESTVSFNTSDWRDNVIGQDLGVA